MEVLSNYIFIAIYVMLCCNSHKFERYLQLAKPTARQFASCNSHKFERYLQQPVTTHVQYDSCNSHKFERYLQRSCIAITSFYVAVAINLKGIYSFKVL